MSNTSSNGLFFEKYRDIKNQWRWRLKSSNGRIIANSGEGYFNLGDCDRGIDLVKSSKPLRLLFEKYRDVRNQWRWRLKATNGRIIANSGEGYFNLGDCDHAIELVKASSLAPVRELV